MKDTFWRDAAKSGLIIGMIVVAVIYIKVLLNLAASPVGLLLSVAELVAVAYFIYAISRRRSTLADRRAGYTYGKNLGFVILAMLFAGFIYGVGYYLLVNFISPDFVTSMIEESINVAYSMYGDMAESVAAMAYRLFASPFFWIFYGVLAMVFYGGIIGLVVSAFVTRKPDIFADND